MIHFDKVLLRSFFLCFSFDILFCVAHISMDSPKLNRRASILCHMEPMMLIFLKISSTGYVTTKNKPWTFALVQANDTLYIQYV